MSAVDLRELYSVPPEEFVATRSAIVAALKADKRRDDAAAVQRLRRPRLAEHALNVAARAEPDIVERWAAAVAAMDAAQSHAIGGGGGAGDLREAAGELRAAHAAVLAAAVHALGASGTAQRDDIAETLRSLAHPEGAPLLRAGVVGSEQLGDLELFAGAPEPVVQRASKAPQPAATGQRSKQPTSTAREPASKRSSKSDDQLATKVDPKRLRALERADAAARTEMEAADVALSAARAAVQAAKEAVAAATNRAAAARSAARDAAQALAALRDGHDGV
jgi:hypothetical protein